MFGCPAVYLDRRLVACVWERSLAIRVPASLAADLVARGRAVRFRPYGRAAMAEWVQVAVSGRSLRRIEEILLAALERADGTAGCARPARPTRRARPGPA